MPSRAAAGTKGAVASERFSLRLIQQVAPGTYGSYVDAVQGVSWSRTPRSGPRQGLNGKGGFVSVTDRPMIGDASEFDLLIPPFGSDGRSNHDRFYFLNDTPDPQSPGATTPYFPGDEWIEVYRGTGELVAVGTPIGGQVKLDSITITCRDVLQPLKKSRETASGYWQNNAPREVFEYYCRLWQSLVADDFDTLSSSFVYSNCSGMSPTGSTAVRILPGGAGAGSVTMAQPFASGAFPIHGGIRVETVISNVAPNPPPGIVATFYLNILGVSGTVYSSFAVSMLDGSVFAATRVEKTASGGFALVNFPTHSGGVSDPTAGRMYPPYTLATEIRERYAYFYLDGQLAAVCAQPNFGAGDELVGQVAFANPGGGSLGSLWVDVDYIVARRTTAPLNGGNPGTYALPSPPAAGGITAEYFDTTQLGQFLAVGALASGAFAEQEAFCEVLGGPTIGTPVAELTENSICSGYADTILPSAIPTYTVAAQPRIHSFYVRRSGAIYLPLADQDVHFSAAVSGELFGPFSTATLQGWPFRLYVGKLRRGEELLAGFTSDPGGGYPGPVQSVGLRSILGNVSGWYPIRFEMSTGWNGGIPPDLVITWDGPGGGEPSPSYLSPLGVWRSQVVDSDSHYDTLIAMAANEAYQFKTTPASLESGSFPGYLVPLARVGRDTNYVLDETNAVDPEDNVDATDVASTLLGDASGLGGNSTGAITAEAFDFVGMGKHPFVSSEADTIPTTNVPAEFTNQLLALLAFRLSPWEDVKASSSEIRQMADAWPPSVVLPQLKEFVWAPGDGLRVDLPKIGVVDDEPRQILQLQQVYYPDGAGAPVASFRPRPRDFMRTMRKFIRQVYGEKRGFQGQIVVKPGTRAASPAYSEALLPSDLGLVRNAQLYVITKDDATTFFDLEVNGRVVAPQSVASIGAVDLRQYIGANVSGGLPEPRMLVRLINPSSADGGVSYQIELVVLIPSL